MKNKTKHITNMRLLLGLTAIAVPCTALPVRAHKPSGGGGGSGGGGVSGPLPYPTASTASQLDADFIYANTNGGTFTIYLQPNTGFTNGQGNWGTVSTKNVNLTIIGNGDTFYGLGNINFFTVAASTSLTLEQMTLQNGYAEDSYGGAIYNSGTLTISNCTLSGNTDNGSDYEGDTEGVGGAIYNNGTVIIENSTLSANKAIGSAFPDGGAIYNTGILTISNSTFINNQAFFYNVGVGFFEGAGGAIFNAGGTVTISHSSFTNNVAGQAGGGIVNSPGTLTIENSSMISGNAPDDVANGGTLYLDSSNEIGILDGNPAIIVQGSGPSPSPRISLTTSNAIVVSWPYPSTGWSLEQNSDLTTTNWVASTNTVANDGTNNFIIAAPSLDQIFFRLEF